MEFLAVTPAEPKPGAAIEENVVFSGRVEVQAPYFLKLNDCRPVNSTESTLVQLLLQFCHAATQEIRSGSDMQTDVVVRGFDPIDLRRRDKGNLTRRFDDEGLPGLPPIPAKRNSLPGAFQCPLKPRIVERLQQVIERAADSKMNCLPGIERRRAGKLYARSAEESTARGAL